MTTQVAAQDRRIYPERDGQPMCQIISNNFPGLSLFKGAWMLYLKTIQMFLLESCTKLMLLANYFFASRILIEHCRIYKTQSLSAVVRQSWDASNIMVCCRRAKDYIIVCFCLAIPKTRGCLSYITASHSKSWFSFGLVTWQPINGITSFYHSRPRVFTAVLITSENAGVSIYL